MTETQTRREREDEIIDKVLKGVAAQSLTKLDCVLYLGMFVSCVVDAHKREDAIRALPRLAQDFNTDFGLHMVESPHGSYFDEDDVLRILDEGETK